MDRRPSDMRPDTEDAADQILGEHGLRRSHSNDLSFLELGEIVAEHRRQIEIVQGNDAGDAELRDEREDIELVLDIEVIGRLVEQEFARGSLGANPRQLATVRVREQSSAPMVGSNRAPKPN